MSAALLLPLLFLCVFAVALFRRVKIYDCFVAGAKRAVPLLVSLFPYLAAVLMLAELFECSGLAALAARALAPLLSAIGIPTEIAPLLLIKPFSGSGSLALLSRILSEYGADSYIARCACVCYGASDTVFYLSAIYFAGTQRKGLLLPVAAALAGQFTATVVGCLLCKWL